MGSAREERLLTHRYASHIAGSTFERQNLLVVLGHQRRGRAMSCSVRSIHDANLDYRTKRRHSIAEISFASNKRTSLLLISCRRS